MILLERADSLDVLEVEWVALDVLELPIVLEVHPGGVRLGHVDGLL